MPDPHQTPGQSETVVEGRWTIYKKAGLWDDAIVGPDTKPTGGIVGVPVVPCDNAAVERATDAALAEMMRLLNADDLDPERESNESPERFVARKAMEAGFRAAGETP